MSRLSLLCIALGALFCFASFTEASRPRVISKIVELSVDEPTQPTGSNQTSIQLLWSGGIPGCSNCGQPGQYACSSGVGKWNNGAQTFADPSPDDGKNYLLTSVTATMYGTVSCGGVGTQTMIQMTINGVVIDVATATSNNLCRCNTCDSPVRFDATSIFFGGMSNYNYGSTNTLQMAVLDGNFICVNRVVLNLTFSIPQWKATTITLPYKGTGVQTCAVCGTAGSYACSNSGSNWNNGIVSFKDPLPKGSLLLDAAARVYGVWMNPFYPFYLQGALTGIVVGAGNLTTPITNSQFCDQCSEPMLFQTDNWYQAGWPGYNYGANNSFQLSFTGSSNGYSQACVSFVQLTLGYYTTS